MNKYPFAYIIIVSILIYIHQVNGLRMNITKDIRGTRMATFPSFRFDPFGEYSFNVTASFQNDIKYERGLDVFLCQEQVLTKLDPYNTYANTNPSCDDLIFLKECHEIEPLKYEPIKKVASAQIEGIIPVQDIYYIFISNCLNIPVKEVNINGYLVNSDRSHISYGSGTTPFIYIAITIIWIGLFSLYTFNLIQFRSKGILITRIIIGCIILHLLNSLYGVIVWKRIRNHGYVFTPSVIVDPNPNNIFISNHPSVILFPFIYWFIESLKISSTMITLLLLSKGLSVTRKRLTKEEWFTIIGLGIMMILMKFVSKLQVIQFSSIPYLIIMILFLKYSFSSINYNINMMQIQEHFLLKMCYINRYSNNTPVQMKLNIYILFQTMMIIYTFITSVSSVVFLFFSERRLWIPIFIEESLNIAVFSFLFYLFRLRETKSLNSIKFKFPMFQHKRKIHSDTPTFIIIQNPPVYVNDTKKPSFSLSTLEGFDTILSSNSQLLQDHHESDEEFQIWDDEDI